MRVLLFVQRFRIRFFRVSACHVATQSAVIAMVDMSVRPVCLSVTHWYCIKMMQATIRASSLINSDKTHPEIRKGLPE